MKHLSSTENMGISNLDISINILDTYAIETHLNKLFEDISKDIRELHYLNACANHFFAMKDVLVSDEKLQNFSNSSEAITSMSKTAQKTMSKMTDYMKTFFKWSDSVLLVSLKNTLRVTTALTKTLRTNPDKKDKLISSYDTKDVSLADYIQCLKNINRMDDEIADCVEKLRNITGDSALTDVSAAKEEINNDTAKYDEFISNFMNSRNDDEKKVSPEDGHWVQDSYVQQLSNAIQECISSLQKVKRMRSTLQQLMNGMNVTVDTATRKTNNEKLDALKELFLGKIKTNLGYMSTLVIYIGKKTQTLLKSME